MRYTYHISIFLCAIIAAAQVMAQDLPQHRWVGDLPIMDEMQIEEGRGLAIDSPDGRIVVVYVSGSMDAEMIESYYSVALPPLGWTEVANLIWQREGEWLTITRVNALSGIWKITISP